MKKETFVNVRIGSSGLSSFKFFTKFQENCRSTQKTAVFQGVFQGLGKKS